ncbi:MAG: TonB-dependent receptor, partial [Acidobacteria bacterium]|nr:TonB-dependent receptor [Acidobacteriota bacterium]
GGTSYYLNEALTTANGQKLAEQLGIKGANLDDWTSGPSTINIGNGFSNPVMGYTQSLPWERSERTWQVAATATKVWNNHTVKFGADWRNNSDLLLQTQGANGPRGYFGFSGAQTGSPADTAANSGIANAFASFLLDAPSSVQRDLKVLDEVGTRHWSFFGFVHDKWQASSKLTIDLGLRWEYYDPLVGLADRGSLSNYDPATNSLLVAGYGSVANDLGVEKDFKNWNPRLGLSYRIADKTVVRAGFGASTTPFPDNHYAYNYPVKQNNSFQTPNNYAPTAVNMAVGFPAPTFVQIPENGIVDANAVLSQALFFVPTDLQPGTVYSWNVAFQRELIWGLTGEVAYVGNRSDDAIYKFQMNAGVVLGAGNAGRPFFKYGKTADIENVAWKGKSRYNGLQMKLDRRFRNGWLVTNSYTYSKARDYNFENWIVSTPADPDRSWGYCNTDRTHVFVSSFVWSLPWFKTADAAVLRWVLGNWQVSGLFTYQSGRPLDVTASATALNAPGNTQRPNLTGTETVLGNYGPGQLYFDTSVYANPAAATFGNMTRNMGDLREPSFTNLDFSVVKQFAFGSRRMGEIRADFFNLPNTLNYSAPNTTLGSTTFGQVTSAYGERQMRFSVRFLF